MKKLLMLFSFLFVTHTLMGQSNLDSGLVAYYPFNDNANDESGNGNNLVISNVSFTSDRFGNSNSACYFNGDDSTYLYVPLETNLSTLVDSIISVVIWFQVDGTSQNFYSSLLSKGTGVHNWWKIGMNNFGDEYTISFSREDSLSGSTPIDYVISDLNIWHCLILRHTLNGEGEAYLDGTTIDTWSASYWTIPANEDPIWIGNMQGKSNVGWNGKIDDIRFYNRKLTNNEIQELSYAPTEVNEFINNTTPHLRLYQNYPNPFNPTTTINYAIPKTSFVTIKVYDILGKEIATLVNEEKPVGHYNVKFSARGRSAYGGNASNLASGIYFYRINAGDYSQTRKMTLMK